MAKYGVMKEQLDKKMTLQFHIKSYLINAFLVKWGSMITYMTNFKDIDKIQLPFNNLSNYFYKNIIAINLVLETFQM